MNDVPEFSTTDVYFNLLSKRSAITVGDSLATVLVINDLDSDACNLKVCVEI